jgi:Tfp pilus assembly protein PilO
MPSRINERRKPMILLGGSLAASAVLLYVAVFGPKIRAIDQLKADAEMKQAQVSAALRAYGEMSESKDQKTRQWDEVLARFDKRVPAEPQQERFMAELGALAVKRQLAEFRLSIPSAGEGWSQAAAPGTAQPAAGEAQGEAGAPAREAFVETRYRISFVSAYRDLADFLDDLPRLDRLVAIRSVKIQSKEGRMETALEISIFHRGTSS